MESVRAGVQKILYYPLPVMCRSAFSASNRLCVANLPAPVDNADLEMTQVKKKKKKQLTCVTAVGSRSIAAISFKAHLTHTSCLNQTKSITQKYKIPTDAQIEETTSCCCSFSLSAHV